MIDIIKKLSKSDDDILIEYFISKACNSINVYLNTEYEADFIKEKYVDAVIQLVIKEFIFNDTKGVTSMKQGERSVTYEHKQIDNSIKKLLPLPGMKVK